ncbi:30S ribosomal protein S2 [bacterium DOLZORAL124_38_8]|nr:MAG: 30S ribosomal protein S2 [bacterium DOLZORAL124_38_8]
MTTKDLFANNAHIGHKTSNWNPKMKPYIHGKVNGVHVFDLEQTEAALEKTKQFLAATKLKNAKVLFVGTKPQSSFVLKKALEGTNHFAMCQKWQPGLLTNFTEIRKRIDYYLNLKSQFETGEINKYTKKEISEYKKDLNKLAKVYEGVAEMRKRPEVIVVLDAVVDRLAVEEAKKAGVGIVAVADSNANPDGIDYVIPANDDAVESIEYIVNEMVSALKK